MCIRDRLTSEAQTVIWFADEENVLAIAGITDRIKETSIRAVSELRAAGIEVHMLTGDNEATAREIARKAGIAHYQASVLPQDKAAFVSRLQAEGRKDVNQSKIAIGSGGFWGKGFLEGTQIKYGFVPERHTDFIFCTVGEEWGFLGTMVVLALLCMLILRLMRMGERQQEPFGRIYCYCVAAILLFHVLVNVGMTIGLMPVMGIPLPFMSYGGSSLIAFTILLFIAVRLDASTRQFSLNLSLIHISEPTRP